MESAAAMSWSIGILLVTLGVVLGIVVGYFFLAPNTKKTAQLQDQLRRVDAEFGEYKQRVSRDYLRTAELINEMTNSYRAVHQHLASSAQELCGDQLANRLELLEQYGAGAGAAAGGAATIEHADLLAETEAAAGSAPVREPEPKADPVADAEPDVPASAEDQGGDTTTADADTEQEIPPTKPGASPAADATPGSTKDANGADAPADAETVSAEAKPGSERPVIH